MPAISFQDRDNFIRNAVTIISPGCAPAYRGRLRKVDAYGDLPMPISDLMLDLSIDDDDFEDVVYRLARFACDFVERKTALVPIQASYEWRGDAFWLGKLEIRRAPCRQVSAIEYLPATAMDGDAWVAVPADQYWVVNNSESFSIRLLDTFTWPDVWQLTDCVRIRFDAGYDADADTGTGAGEFPMPDSLRTLITMMTAHCYAHRELFEADKAAEIEHGLGSILGSYATYW